MLNLTKFLWASLLVLLLLQLSCKTTPVEPPLKDPRTYTWTIDTLTYPSSAQTLMQDIWGSSPSNVYVVGHNDNPGVPTMFRFDGRGWKTTGFHAGEGGTVAGPVSLYSIHGFGPNNIFAVGRRIYDNPNPPPNFLDSSLIIQYDGSRWREHRVVGRFLHAIWGSDPQNIWVSGEEGSLFHYNGQSWAKETIPVTPPPGSYYKLYGIGGTSPTDMCLLASAHEDPFIRTTFYFLRRNASGWAVIDTFVNQPGISQNKWGDSKLWASSWGTLYSVGKGAFQWNGETWSKILSTDEPCTNIFGTSEKNLFVITYQSSLLHFNGVDWYQYGDLKFQNFGFSSGWTDGKEIFAVGWTRGGFPQKTLILRGK